MGYGISDMATGISGGGDRRRNVDVLQDLSARGRVMQAPELRGVVTVEIREAMNVRRVRRMLSHDAQKNAE